MSDDAPTVAQLLQQSRAQNLERLRASQAKPPNYPQAEAHAATALRLREWAHELDPEHGDPEWQNDKVPHDAVIAFLRQYPNIP